MMAIKRRGWLLAVISLAVTACSGSAKDEQVPAPSSSSSIVQSTLTASTAGTPSTSTAPQPAPFRVDFDTSQRVALGRIERVVPDRLVLIDARIIALEWTSGCNVPAARVTIDQRERLQIELFVGFFRVIDCVGEPTRWHIVLPVPQLLTPEAVAVDHDGRTSSLRIDRLDGATSSVIRDGLTVLATNVQFTSVLDGSRRFDARCSPARVTRIGNGIETFDLVEQADDPTGTCKDPAMWVWLDSQWQRTKLRNR